jgi:hypothetical protein
MKSKAWKAAEPKIIEWIGMGYGVEEIKKEVAKKYTLGNDVIKFINDQK